MTSSLEPSIQSHSSYNNNSYMTQEITNDDDDGSMKNLKYSLASYFSMIFVVFVGLLLISTIILFIWSNTSDGAWVSLQASPVIPNNDKWSLPITFSFTLLNDKLLTSNNEKLNKLSSLFLNEDNLNIMEYSINKTITDISDLNINMNIFHFSLVGSVSDFWQSKAYSLAILIAIFSGIWPYIKLLLLCYCWIIPMKQVNREGILIFLDQMGKFSFIDLFVSLYMIVSFYVDITEQLPQNGYGINLKVIVEPDVGLNTFVIGTVISMIFSHFFLYLDAKYAKPHIKELIALQQINDDDNIIINNDNYDYNKEQKEIERIKNKHEWNNSYKPFFIKYLPFSYFGILIRSIMLILIWITLYMIIDTVFTAPVRYNIAGLVGFFVNNPQRSYSAWQIVSEVPSHTDQHIAAPPLSACLFCTIILFPILLLFIIVIIWYFPLKYKYLNYLNIFMQISMAWSALDVFAVASIAASLELSRVSQWILNDSYAKICGTNPPGIIPKILKHLTGKDAGCFSVNGYLVSPGIYIVIFGACFAWILFIYTIYQLYKSNKYLKTDIKKSLPDKTIFFFNH